jgi:hypothetical protein
LIVQCKEKNSEKIYKKINNTKSSFSFNRLIVCKCKIFLDSLFSPDCLNTDFPEKQEQIQDTTQHQKTRKQQTQLITMEGSAEDNGRQSVDAGACSDGPTSLVGAGPPSPLTGCYLLIVVGEPHTAEHKDMILQRLIKGNPKHNFTT